METDGGSVTFGMMQDID